MYLAVSERLYVDRGDMICQSLGMSNGVERGRVSSGIHCTYILVIGYTVHEIKQLDLQLVSLVTSSEHMWPTV